MSRRRSTKFADQVLAATADLRDEVNQLRFSDPVAWVYNPLDYAWGMHERYVRKWGANKRRILMMGMNPGPWGMVQTGVPFGEISAVKGFLQLKGKVGKPDPEHPKRPVSGLDCTRSEVSGSRLWGLMEEKFGTAEAFFEEHCIANYCPLVFMEESARNYTPDKLPVAESAPLFAACDRHLISFVDLYQPEWVVGVGAFARKKLITIFGEKAELGSEHHRPANIGMVLHPSPASPAANRGWSEAAQKQLVEQKIW
ncbi:MAG: single-strand selective monofunctional uracil DNA glycosylase [Candidatus Krumholzibacteriia bacterium]